MIDIFLDRLNTIVPIPQVELDKLKNISTLSSIKKGEYFLRQGDKSSSLAFILSGLFRTTYLTENGKEFTKTFLLDNDFLISYSALLQNRESYFSIEALEDSSIVVIDYHKWKELFKDEISWNQLLVVVLEKVYCKKEAREREFLLHDAQTRYESFLREHPNLVKRIKQHILASYLGITPVALSNLKKRVKS